MPLLGEATLEAGGKACSSLGMMEDPATIPQTHLPRPGLHLSDTHRYLGSGRLQLSSGERVSRYENVS